MKGQDLDLIAQTPLLQDTTLDTSLKTLIVDDDAGILELLINITQSLGQNFKVYPVPNKELALDLLKKETFDIALLDVHLRGVQEPNDLSGVEVLRKLREYSPSAYPIMISGDEDSKIIDQCFDLGAREYIQKPFSVDYLRLKITNATESILSQRKLMTTTEALYVDPTTGLYTRHFFNPTLDIAIANAYRNGTPLSLIAGDLDHFKEVNDNYGHPEGDKVLGLLGNTLLSIVRNTDSAARTGGDEYSIILPNTFSEQALMVAERIRAGIEEHGNKHECKFTTSIGVATFTEFPKGKPPSFYLRKADAALYAAKEAGRNRVEVWNPTMEVKE